MSRAMRHFRGFQGKYPSYKVVLVFYFSPGGESNGCVHLIKLKGRRVDAARPRHLRTHDQNLSSYILTGALETTSDLGRHCHVTRSFQIWRKSWN